MERNEFIENYNRGKLTTEILKQLRHELNEKKPELVLTLQDGTVYVCEVIRYFGEHVLVYDKDNHCTRLVKILELNKIDRR